MGGARGEPVGPALSALERLTHEIGEVRGVVHPAVRARRLAEVQRLCGWALREAVTECRELGGMTWRDTASAVEVPFGTLYRQYRAGGRIVVGDAGPQEDEGAPEVDILVLGELVVRIGGRNVRLPGPGVRALLGALVLTPGDVVGEERLLELAWGAEKGSRRALQCAVHRLRAWLREVAGAVCRLEHAGSGYLLSVRPGVVDLVRFRERVRAGSAGGPEQQLDALSAALGEWRGPVLGGRPEWLATDPTVRAVEQERVDCAGALADLAVRLGRPGDAVPLVGEVAATAPYDEPLQARLVRLLSMCGRHAEALRRVEQVRQRLADDLGIAPSREVRSAHAAALQGDDRFAALPMELPPDVPDFTGRRAETAAISEPLLGWRSRSGPLVFAISGPAGAGKSALAVHVAHRLAALFVNGQLYADLRRPGGTRPVDPAEVLERFLRALGVARSSIPGTLADRAALFRSRTAGRRILVVLDDAAEAAQVRPLVPGTDGCAVLVTSRAGLGGLTGARQVPLGALPRDDAVRLLGRVCGRGELPGGPAAEIARLCDHLPLAVRIAGARLAVRPGLGLERLAARLRDETRRLDELAVDGLAVRPSLEAAYLDLSPERRRAFRLLSLPGKPVLPARAAAALLGGPPDEAIEHVESLVDARLLEALDDDTYAFADLVRLFALERSLAEDPAAVREAALRAF